MISELIIASTLVLNAFAILNFKLTRSADPSAFIGDVAGRSIGDRIREFLASLQYFRVFIALWNVFLIFVMFIFVQIPNLVKGFLPLYSYNYFRINAILLALKSEAKKCR